jgi:uncharacterized protein
MPRAPLTAPLDSVRRLVVTRQRLAGNLPTRPGKSAILSVVRDLGFVQWDPVTTVAPSHLLSLWSRLGNFRQSDLEGLLWTEKKLFLHWTPAASIVRMEDFPIYHALMRRYPASFGRSWGAQGTRAERFLATHGPLRRRVLADLRNGPLLLGQFRDHARTQRTDGEWSSGSEVSHLLFHLLMNGEVMVVGHEGNQNLWGLSGRFLPEWVDRTELSEEAVERAAAQRAIRALGVATPTEINFYFVRGRYQDLRGTLAKLLGDGVISRVEIEGSGRPEERYILSADVPLLSAMDGADGPPRVSLLPPFDTMLGSQKRTRRLFEFDYVREQFLPRSKRRYGKYVLPILRGERFIGRVDPQLDKARRELVIHAVHAEPDAPRGKDVARDVAESIAALASFVGADRVTYTSRVPDPWKSSLH